MRMINKYNILKKIITFGMICIMGMLIINNSVFMHTHKLSDGTVIIHSHPYDKSNDSKSHKTHHHTKAEFVFLENIEILKSYFYSHIISGNTSSCIIIHNGRAPPYVS